MKPYWLAIVCILLCGFSGSSWAEQPARKNVLLLFTEYHQRGEFLELFESSVRAQVPGQIVFLRSVPGISV